MFFKNKYKINFSENVLNELKQKRFNKKYFSKNVLNELKQKIFNKKYFSKNVLNELKQNKFVNSKSKNYFCNNICKILLITKNNFSSSNLDYCIKFKDEYIDTIYKYNFSLRELYQYYEPLPKKYIINFENLNCSCKSYKYSSENNKSFICKHLYPYYLKKIKQNFILVSKQYMSINQAIDVCTYCI